MALRATKFHANTRCRPAFNPAGLRCGTRIRWQIGGAAEKLMPWACLARSPHLNQSYQINVGFLGVVVRSRA